MSALGAEAARAIGDALSELERDVPVLLEVGPPSESVTVLAGGRELDFAAEARKLATGVAELSDRVRLDIVERETPGSYPRFTIGDGLRYHGLPWGYELAAFVGAIALASADGPRLTDASLEALAGLDRETAVDVWVTPT